MADTLPATVPLAACPICGATSFGNLGERSDGIAVLRCERCRMGMVARRPRDPAAYYSDAYYSSVEEGESGYSAYPMVAAHSLGWVAELIRILRGDGRVLDVGCADGHLLQLLGRPYELHGIEVNEHLAERCRRTGIEMLGRDICDPLLATHHGTFDIVTAIAVLEHVTDIRTALRQIRDLLTPGGVVIFEVPLISPTEDNRVWFTSSLEHVYYPTPEGLAFLFASVFELPLIGREVAIRGYGSTFVGLATRDPAKHRELATLLTRLVDAPIATLVSRQERSFRFFFDLVHAADPTPQNVALLAEIEPSLVSREILHRLAALWELDLSRAGGPAAVAGDGGTGPAEAAVAPPTYAVRAVRDGRDRRLAGQQARLTARDLRIAELAAELAAREQQVAALDAELAAQGQRFRQLLASTSWRAAAPLRLAGRGLKAGIRSLPLRPGSALWKSVRSFYRLLPLPGAAKERLLAAAVGGGFLPAAGPSAPADEPLAPGGPGPSPALGNQEPWPASRPLVSVVIPCYNYGHFAAEAVDSVLAQTFQDLEILVVDGGSGTQSVNALKALRRPRTRVYYRSGRRFVGDNRNYGIARARGKYVCCLDADDTLRPTYIEKAVFLLETQGYDLVSTSIQTFGDDTTVYCVQRFPVLADMVRDNHVPTCAVFRRELWERAGGFQDHGIGREYIFEDWRLWVRFAALGARITNIVDEALFRYRVHSRNSLSKQDGILTLDEQRQAILAFNQDVLTAEAFRHSEERARLSVHLPDPLLNLRGRRRPEAGAPVILLALPFLIVGGAERLLSEVALHLRFRGYRLVLVTTLFVDPEYGDSTPWFEGATDEIYHLPRFLAPERWREFVFYLLETREVALLWLVGSAFFYDLLPAIRAEWPDLKVLDLLFNTVGHTANNRRRRESIDLTLVENAEVYDWLRREGETPERLALIPSGVDLERFRPAPRARRRREELALYANSFVVGFSGRLSEEKSPETFLAIAERCRDDSRLVFLMTGAGPLAQPLRQEAERLGLGQSLRLLGQVPEVRDYLATYDVLVLPSRLDGRPIVVLESLAMGIPVIASGVGALPEIVQEGETGFLCAPGDVAAFADRVRWLADHPAEHRRMRAAARAYAERELDARQMLRRYEEAIQAVLPKDLSAAGALPHPLPPGEGNPIVLTLPFFTVGGAERVIETLLAHWRRQGRTVIVFTTQPLQPGMVDRAPDLRALTPWCVPLRELLAPESWLDCLVETLLGLERPILLNIGSRWFYEIAEEVRDRLPQVRIVDQLFNAVSHLDLNQRVAASLDLTIGAYAHLADGLQAAGRPADHVATVYVGIEPPRVPDPEELAAFRRRLEVPEPGRLIAFVGRLAEEKRPDWVVRLCREIADPAVRTAMVGDGPLAAALDLRAVDRLTWIRRCDDIAPVLAAADVVVVPSRFEGIPLVLMEALALGRPVVATRVGGIPELAGTPGLTLVEADDYEAFRATVVRILEQPPAAGAGGISLPASLRADEMVRRYDELLFGEGQAGAWPP